MVLKTTYVTDRKDGVLKAERDRGEPREQHDLEGLRAGYHAQYRPRGRRGAGLQEVAYRQPGGQHAQRDVGDRDAEIGGEYDDRHAAHHAEQVAAGDDEEQVADDDRERHQREQPDEDHGDDPGVLMLDPVEQQLYDVPVDEDDHGEEGQGRDRDRDVAYRVRADAAEVQRRGRRALGGAHPSLDVVHIDQLVHVFELPL